LCHDGQLLQVEKHLERIPLQKKGRKEENGKAHKEPAINDNAHGYNFSYLPRVHEYLLIA